MLRMVESGILGFQELFQCAAVDSLTPDANTRSGKQASARDRASILVCVDIARVVHS